MANDERDPVPFTPPRGKGATQRKQKGAQQHAEGMQGPKARAHLMEQLRSGPSGTAAQPDHSHGDEGKHRLFEGREQHDEADRNSEKNRLSRDIRDHGHNRENFQVPGGSASSRAMPRNPINPGEPDAPTPGVPQAPPPRRVPGVGAS
jgi:hypothetical protein